LDTIDLSKMERTWGNIYGENPRYAYSLGDLRKKMSDERRNTSFLKDTETDNSAMRQLYTHRGNRELGEFDEVIEPIWEVRSGKIIVLFSVA
jgi:hypothetical protein